MDSKEYDRLDHTVQKIVVATDAGWRRSGQRGLSISGESITERWYNIHDEYMILCPFSEVPDYLNDLNAIHKAEKRMTKDQANAFIVNLDRLCGLLTEKDSVFAEASLRAKAFVLTMRA